MKLYKNWRDKLWDSILDNVEYIVSAMVLALMIFIAVIILARP